MKTHRLISNRLLATGVATATLLAIGASPAGAASRPHEHQPGRDPAHHAVRFDPNETIATLQLRPSRGVRAIDVATGV